MEMITARFVDGPRDGETEEIDAATQTITVQIPLDNDARSDASGDDPLTERGWHIMLYRRVSEEPESDGTVQFRFATE